MTAPVECFWDDDWLKVRVGGLQFDVADFMDTPTDDVRIYGWSPDSGVPQGPLLVPVTSRREAVAVIRALVGVRGIEVPPHPTE